LSRGATESLRIATPSKSTIERKLQAAKTQAEAATKVADDAAAKLERYEAQYIQADQVLRSKEAEARAIEATQTADITAAELERYEAEYRQAKQKVGSREDEARITADWANWKRSKPKDDPAVADAIANFHATELRLNNGTATQADVKAARKLRKRAEGNWYNRKDEAEAKYDKVVQLATARSRYELMQAFSSRANLGYSDGQIGIVKVHDAEAKLATAQAASSKADLAQKDGQAALARAQDTSDIGKTREDYLQRTKSTEARIQELAREVVEGQYSDTLDGNQLLKRSALILRDVTPVQAKMIEARLQAAEAQAEAATKIADDAAMQLKRYEAQYKQAKQNLGKVAKRRLEKLAQGESEILAIQSLSPQEAAEQVKADWANWKQLKIQDDPDVADTRAAFHATELGFNNGKATQSDVDTARQAKQRAERKFNRDKSIAQTAYTTNVMQAEAQLATAQDQYETAQAASSKANLGYSDGQLGIVKAQDPNEFKAQEDYQGIIETADARMQEIAKGIVEQGSVETLKDQLELKKAAEILRDITPVQAKMIETRLQAARAQAIEATQTADITAADLKRYEAKYKLAKQNLGKVAKQRLGDLAEGRPERLAVQSLSPQEAAEQVKADWDAWKQRKEGDGAATVSLTTVPGYLIPNQLQQPLIDSIGAAREDYSPAQIAEVIEMIDALKLNIEDIDTEEARDLEHYKSEFKQAKQNLGRVAKQRLEKLAQGESGLLAVQSLSPQEAAEQVKADWNAWTQREEGDDTGDKRDWNRRKSEAKDAYANVTQAEAQLATAQNRYEIAQAYSARANLEYQDGLIDLAKAKDTSDTSARADVTKEQLTYAQAYAEDAERTATMVADVRGMEDYRGTGTDQMIRILTTGEQRVPEGLARIAVAAVTAAMRPARVTPFTQAQAIKRLEEDLAIVGKGVAPQVIKAVSEGAIAVAEQMPDADQKIRADQLIENQPTVDQRLVRAAFALIKSSNLAWHIRKSEAQDAYANVMQAEAQLATAQNRHELMQAFSSRANLGYSDGQLGIVKAQDPNEFKAQEDYQKLMGAASKNITQTARSEYREAKARQRATTTKQAINMVNQAGYDFTADDFAPGFRPETLRLGNRGMTRSKLGRGIPRLTGSDLQFGTMRDGAEFMDSSDGSDPVEVRDVRVIQFNGKTKTYPEAVYAQHEIINDSITDDAGNTIYFAIVNCPLCATDIVLNREVIDPRTGKRQIVTFGAAGLLDVQNGNTQIVIDVEELDTLVLQSTLQPIAGRTDLTIKPLDPDIGGAGRADRMTFQEAMAKYPEAQFMLPPQGFSFNYRERPYKHQDNDSQLALNLPDGISRKALNNARMVTHDGELTTVYLGNLAFAFHHASFQELAVDQGRETIEYTQIVGDGNDQRRLGVSYDSRKDRFTVRDESGKELVTMERMKAFSFAAKFPEGGFAFGDDPSGNIPARTIAKIATSDSSPKKKSKASTHKAQAPSSSQAASTQEAPSSKASKAKPSSQQPSAQPAVETAKVDTDTPSPQPATTETPRPKTPKAKSSPDQRQAKAPAPKSPSERATARKAPAPVATARPATPADVQPVDPVDAPAPAPAPVAKVQPATSRGAAPSLASLRTESSQGQLVDLSKPDWNRLTPQELHDAKQVDEEFWNLHRRQNEFKVGEVEWKEMAAEKEQLRGWLRYFTAKAAGVTEGSIIENRETQNGQEGVDQFVVGNIGLTGRIGDLDAKLNFNLSWLDSGTPVNIESTNDIARHAVVTGDWHATDTAPQPATAKPAPKASRPMMVRVNGSSEEPTTLPVYGIEEDELSAVQDLFNRHPSIALNGTRGITFTEGADTSPGALVGDNAEIHKTALVDDAVAGVAMDMAFNGSGSVDSQARGIVKLLQANMNGATGVNRIDEIRDLIIAKRFSEATDLAALMLSPETATPRQPFVPQVPEAVQDQDSTGPPAPSQQAESRWRRVAKKTIVPIVVAGAAIAGGSVLHDKKVIAPETNVPASETSSRPTIDPVNEPPASNSNRRIPDIANLTTPEGLVVGDVRRPTQLSQNFVLGEFDQRGEPLDPNAVRVDPELVFALERFRALIGDKEIQITSGYRTPDYNDSVGGVPGSQHIIGTAVDIVVDGMSSEELEPLAKQAGFIFTQSYRGSPHLHVDVRDAKLEMPEKEGSMPTSLRLPQIEIATTLRDVLLLAMMTELELYA